MNIVSTLSEWRELRQTLQGRQIGFVPTMGNLHAGHMSLCERSLKQNELTVVSIFVNPTQFNQASDFERYPRTIAADIELLSSHQVDYLILPTADELYPDHYQVQVTETELSQTLEGEFRPGHFNGMLTVVLKLLNLVQPTNAYFGEKDYQQYLLVQKMVAALFLPMTIHGCLTQRAQDGLALSSRNNRLNETERAQAALFPQLLQQKASTAEIQQQLEAAGFKVDYVAEKWGRRLAAIWLGEVRLIDNIAY